MAVLSFAQIYNYEKIRYNLLKNPIFVFTPCYFVLFIMLRLGAYTPFVPSFMSNEQGIIGSSYMAVIGYFPELLFLVEIPLCMLIDQIFYRFIDDRLHKFVVEQSHSEDLKLNK